MIRDLAKALDDISAKSSTRNWIYGRLGKFGGTAEGIDVEGRPGYVYVTMGMDGDQGVTIAKNKGGAAKVVFQSVRMKRELGELVIYEATSYAVAEDSGSGGGSDTFMGLDDVESTGWDNGEIPVWNSTLGKLVPAAPAAGTVYSEGNGIDITTGVISVVPAAAGGLGFIGTELAIKRQANSGLVIDGNGIAIDSAIAGNGLGISATKALSVNTGRGLEIVTDAVRVDEDFAFNWAGLHTFTLDPQLQANLDFVGAVNHEITATNSLTIRPATDLRLDPGGMVAYPDSQKSRTDTFIDSVTGILGFELADWSAIEFPPGVLGGNTMGLKLNYLKVDNLFARKFTADEVRVQRGEWFLTRSFGIVETDFTVPAINATVDVWFEEAPGLDGAKLFLKDNWIEFRTIDLGTGLVIQTVYYQVVDADGTGTQDYIQRLPQAGEQVARQQWRLIRRSGGFTGMKTKKGEAGADIGQPRHMDGIVEIPDQGVIYATSLFDSNGPFIQTQTFDHVTANVPQFKSRTRMGNLMGVADYIGETYGFAAADDLSKLPSAGMRGITIDINNGARLFNTDLYLYESAIIQASLTRTYGLNFQNDIALFSNDTRVIGWYDNLANIGTANPTAKISSWGPASNRQMHIHSLGTQLAGVFVSADNGDEEDGATIAVRSGWFGLAGGYIGLFADHVTHIGGFDAVGNIRPRFRVGGNDGDVARTNFHVYVNSAGILDTTGMMMEQGGTGDSLFHWKNPGGQQFVAGIDQTNGHWKLRAGNSIRGLLASIDINPSTGVVTINGLSGSGTGSLDATGGDGIDLDGTEINVDGTVVRTWRTVVGTNGVAGGGSLDGNLVLYADATVVRTNFEITTEGALRGGRNLADTVRLSLALATNSGLNQTDGLALDVSAAGAGLTFTSGVLNVIGGYGIIVRANNIEVDPNILGGGGGGGSDYAAGAGLVRTGSAPNYTLDIGQGTGIIVDPDLIKLDNAYILSTVLVGRTIVAGNGLLGGGALSANVTLDVNPGAGIALSSDKVIVDLNYAFTWAAAHQFNVTPQLNANLNFMGAERSITTTGGYNLNIAPAGDLVLAPAGLDVLPGGSIITNLGGYSRKWAALYANELVVQNLVAASVMATIGGNVRVGPTTQLIAALTTGATTIDIKHGSPGFVQNTYIILQTYGASGAQFEAMKLTSGQTVIAGGFRFNVSRNLTGSGAKAWEVGDAVFSMGAAVGSGFIDIASLSTVTGHIGPTIAIYSRTATTAWNSVVPVAAMGQLQSFAGIGTSKFGFAAANDLTLGPSSGLSGVVVTAPNSVAGTSGGMALYNTTIALYNGSNLVAALDRGNGLMFEYGTSSDRTISWHEDLIPAVDFTAMAGTVFGDIGMEHDLSPYNRLVISAYPGNAPYTQGAILLRAEDAVLGRTHLQIDKTGFHFGVGNTYPSDAYARINSAGMFVGGSVGIGVSTPYNMLHVRASAVSGSDSGVNDILVVENNGSCYVNVISNPGNTGGYLFSDGERAMGYILYKHTNDSMEFYTNSYINTTPNMVMDSVGRIAIGVAAPSTMLHVVGGTGEVPSSVFSADDVLAVERNGNSFVNITAAPTGACGVLFSDDVRAAGYISYDHSNSSMGFYTGAGTIRMTIDATGAVGIGTTTPTATETYSRLTTEGASVNPVYASIINTGSGQTALVLRRTGTAPTRWALYAPTGLDQIRVSGGSPSSDVMTFSPAGVGLFTTDIGPGHASWNNFHIGAAGLILSGKATAGLYLADNAYYDGTWKRRIAGAASHYVQSAGAHIWSSASNLGAGVAISPWAEAMRIDASGRVGIGTSTPEGTETYSRFTVESFHASAVYTSVINTGTGSVGTSWRRSGGTASAWYAYVPSGNNQLRIYGGGPGDVMSFGVGGIGIGTTDIGPGDSLYGQIQLGATGVLAAHKTATSTFFGDNAYRDNGTWKRRIQNPASLITLYNGTMYFAISPSDLADTAITWTNAIILNATGTLTMLPTYNATVTVVPNMSISSSGLVTRTTHVNSSLRYKKEIRPLASGESFLRALKPVNYLFREEHGGDGRNHVGFIAEDVLAAGGGDYIQYDDEGRPDVLMYDRLTAPLVLGWQAHEREIQLLKQEISDLRRRLN